MTDDEVVASGTDATQKPTPVVQVPIGGVWPTPTPAEHETAVQAAL